MYTCATSVPATSPTFATSKLTWTVASVPQRSSDSPAWLAWVRAVGLEMLRALKLKFV